jgi:hypothetical protein
MPAAARESLLTVDGREGHRRGVDRGIRFRVDDQGDLLRGDARDIQADRREDHRRGVDRGIRCRAADREDLLQGDVPGIRFRASVPDALLQAAARDGADACVLDAGSRVDPDRRACVAAADQQAAHEADPDVSVLCRVRGLATGIASPHRTEESLAARGEDRTTDDPEAARTLRRNRSSAGAAEVPGVPEEAWPGNAPASFCGDRIFQDLEMP